MSQLPFHHAILSHNFIVRQNCRMQLYSCKLQQIAKTNTASAQFFTY